MAMPSDIPIDRASDSTMAFFREGYDFISNRCDRFGSDIFQARIMLRNVIYMRGPQAARLLYGEKGLTRRGSMPQTVLRLLQDKGSVQQLDDGQHLHRKTLFIRMLMQPRSSASLVAGFREEWDNHFRSFPPHSRIVLIDAANRILTIAVCRWAGVPLPPTEVDAMTKALAGMVENAGHVRPATFGALFRRSNIERHLRTVIQEVRSGRLAAPKDAPISMIADHIDFDGKPLSLSTAAVELLNVLRPVVAIGRFITFGAMALHQHPEWKHRFEAGDDGLIDAFVEEVRRTTPFFPVVGAVAARDIHWRDYHFVKGQWFLLDLYGTNRDGRLFPDPTAFRPERNLSWRNQDWNFIPQGAGPASTTHRCPGEQITVDLMAEAVRQLSCRMHYDVPDQDLNVRKSRIPALPESGFIISNVSVAAREPPPEPG